MFDFGWSELLIIAVVAIIVIGPKDLPRVLRGLGRAMGAVKRTASEFRAQFEDAIRESELEELRQDFENVRSIDPMAGVQRAIEETLEAPDTSAAVPAAKPKPRRKAASPARKTKSKPKKTAATGRAKRPTSGRVRRAQSARKGR